MLKIGGRRFQPGWLISLIALCALATAVSLGNWQVRRAGEKLALQERLDDKSRIAAVQLTQQPAAAGAMDYSRVTARGEFLPQYTVLLDNRILKSQVGYYVLTPFRMEGGNLCVLVNRGWVAAGARREELPQIATPAGTQTIEGIAVPPPRNFFEFKSAVDSGPVWQNLKLDNYAAQTKLLLQPFLLQQLDANGDNLARIQDRPDTGVNMHRGYAFQWYALAVLIVVLYISLNFKRKNGEDKSETEI